MSTISYTQELFLTSEAASNEAKNRKVILLNTDFTSTGQSYTPTFGLMYGISGKLTFMGKAFYSRNANEQFLGDIDLGSNYRFVSQDKRNFHYRISLMTHIRIPTEQAQSVNENSVLYDKDFSSSTIIGEYRTDNWVPYISFASTILENKFAANLQLNYAYTIPKGDYKFGNYFMSGLAFGYLILPQEYKDYQDINLNFYFEPKAYYFSHNKIAGSELINSGGWEGQISTGIQFIFNSTTLIEIGYTKTFAEKNISIEKDVFFTSMKYLFF